MNTPCQVTPSAAITKIDFWIKFENDCLDYLYIYLYHTNSGSSTWIELWDPSDD